MIPELEALKELPAPPANLPPCDVRYFTLSYCQRIGWCGDWHKTLESAQREAEYCVPGTLRIFEIPEDK